MIIRDYQSFAAALYAVGWRSEDAVEIQLAYKLSEYDTYIICDYLLMFEISGR